MTSITKRYGNVTALNGIDLSVRQGEFVTLLGPSGSGKTTLLNMVAGLGNPDEGRIVIGGQDVTRIPSNGRNIGLVFQNYALFPHMTVFDNISPFRCAYGARRPTRSSGLWRRRWKPSELAEGSPTGSPRSSRGGSSSAWRSRAPLFFEPSILLLDEPLGALDKNLREDLQFELRQLHKVLGITTVMVTHDQEEAMSLSDRVVVFKAGDAGADWRAGAYLSQPGEHVRCQLLRRQQHAAWRRDAIPDRRASVRFR